MGAAAQRRADAARRRNRRRHRRSADSSRHSSASRTVVSTRRVGGEERAVERADRRADDEVGDDPGLEQRPQHADLTGAEHAAAAEDEGGRRPRSGVRHDLDPATCPPSGGPRPADVAEALSRPVESVHRREPVRRPARVLRRRSRWPSPARRGAAGRRRRVGGRPSAGRPRPRSPRRCGRCDREVDRVGRELWQRRAGATSRRRTGWPASTQDRMRRPRRRRGPARPTRRPRAASFGGLARAAYKGGVPPLVTALLSGDPRSVSDLAYVQRSVAALGVAAQRAGRDRRASRRGRPARSWRDRTPTGGRGGPAAGGRRAARRRWLPRPTGSRAELAVSADALARARAHEAARARGPRLRRPRARAARAGGRRRAAAARRAAAGAGGRAPPSRPATSRCRRLGRRAAGRRARCGEANGFLSRVDAVPAVGRRAATGCAPTRRRPSSGSARRTPRRSGVRCASPTPTAATPRRSTSSRASRASPPCPGTQPARLGPRRSTCAAASRSSAARPTSGCARTRRPSAGTTRGGRSRAAASPSRGTGSSSGAVSTPASLAASDRLRPLRHRAARSRDGGRRSPRASWAGCRSG